MEIKKKLIPSLLAILFFTSCKQNDSYHIEKKNSVFHYSSKDSTDKELNFSSVRKFINDSTFIDSDILCSNDTASACSIKFMISNNVWYILNNDKWELFFDKKIYVTNYGKENYTIRPSNIFRLEKTDLYGFTYTNESLTYPGHYLEYLFSPDHGVVVFKKVGGYFKRDDFNDPQLDKIMERL